MLKRLGFLGAGKMAQAHARAAVKIGAEVTVVSGVNSDSNNLKEFMKLAPRATVENSEWFRKSGEVDAWIVAAPWYSIPGMARLLLASPLPMLIEKPLSLHDQPFPSGEHEVNKSIGFNRRFYQPVRELKSAVERSCAKSAVVTISDMIDAIVLRHGKGVLPYAMEMWASHILDLVQYLFGHPEIVWRSVSEWPKSYLNVEAMLVAGRDRTPIHLSINADDPSPVGVRVRMSDGTTHVLAPVECLTTYKGMEVSESEGVRCYRGCEVRRTICPDNGFKPGIYEQMHAFLHQNRTRLATIADARRIHQIIHELRRP